MSGMENLRVVLVGTRNPLNLGAVARAMSNFGALDLRVVSPYEKAWREARSAVGAAELLAKAEEFATVAEAVADCTLVVGTTAVGYRELQQPLRSLQAAGPVIRKRLATSKVALLFGSEKWGLSNESLSHCHWLLRIPTRAEHRSMNLGQAVAVCLYEMGKGGRERLTTEATEEPQRAQRRAEKKKVRGSDELPATMETVERIGAVILEALRKSGYVAKRGEGKAEEKLRRMLRRFSLSEADAEVLVGMIRKILWKVESR